MSLLLSTLPLVLYAGAVHFDRFGSEKQVPPGEPQAKARKWLFRVLTSALLTLQLGKRALDCWWGQLLFVASQLLLVEVTSFSDESLSAFSRCLLPSQLGLIAVQGNSAIPFTFAIRTAAALLKVTPSNVEHVAQITVLLPVMMLQMESWDDANLSKLALYLCCSVLLPFAVEDATQLLLKINEKVMLSILPRFEVEFQNAPTRWSILGSFVSFASVILAQLLELNSGTYYDLLWQVVSMILIIGSAFSWGLTFCNKEVGVPGPAMIAPAPTVQTSNGITAERVTMVTTAQPSNQDDKTTSYAENVFLQRARHEDLMTFQAAMSFIHMLLVLFMTSIDLPHLAFVNLAVIAGLLFQEHSAASLHELVSGVVVAQALSLLALKHQLNDALLLARDVDPNAQLGGVDAIVEQVGLVYCSIRLVAGAILAENFSRHSAETLLLASISVYCSSGYSTRYLCLVMSWMAMFAARIRASAWAVASAWLNSEAELRRFMDHELKVSFAGIMLALEHCLTDEGLTKLPDETVDMLKEALAECKRGKELCFEAAVQRLAYDNAYELRIEGRTLGEGLQTSYHSVEQIMTPSDKTRVVYTDWNLVNHILDNAVANGAKYGTNLSMNSSLTNIGAKDGTSGLRPAMLKVRVTNVPALTERYEALLQMPDTNILFEDTVISRVRNHMWSLGSGRNSTHLGLPVAKLFASRLGGTVALLAKRELTTFSLDVPVHIGSKAAKTTSGSSGKPTAIPERLNGSHHGSHHESSQSDVDVPILAPNRDSLPPGLVFAVLDDSSMIRSTMALTLKRDFQASDKSIVVGATPEEAAKFAQRVKALNADICIVDENLDYDVAGASMVGTKIVEELRATGYTGVIVLYSANEKLEMSVNWGLVDGFASKSANRSDTKRLLTKIYHDCQQRKQNEFLRRRSQSPVMQYVSSGLSSNDEAVGSVQNETRGPIAEALQLKAAVLGGRYRVFVSPGVDRKQGAPTTAVRDLSGLSPGQHHIAVVPAESGISAAVRAVDPNVAVVGILPSSANIGVKGVAYSPFVRFVAGLPAVDATISVEALQMFVGGFDALLMPEDMTALDPGILGELVQKKSLFAARFLGGAPINQDMDFKKLDEDFETLDERNSMIEVMEETVTQSLQRVYRRTTLDNVSKQAHLIKGASLVIGARALHKVAAKTEKMCDAEFDGPLSEVHHSFAHFMLLMTDFLRAAKTYMS